MNKLVWRRIVEVAAAAKDRATNGSRAWWPPWANQASPGNG
jgi:hypothetical protein